MMKFLKAPLICLALIVGAVVALICSVFLSLVGIISATWTTIKEME
jgi:hypothetical protein